MLRLLPKGLTFEPLDLEKHPKHGLYIPFYNIVGLARMWALVILVLEHLERS